MSIVPGTVDIGNHTDDGTTPITLPFSFSFYGSLFATVNASSNGNLQFTSNNTAFSNVCLPTATMNNLISPFWDDQCTGPCFNVTGTTYGIFTSTTGVSPNRIFNIEWRAAYYNSGGAGVPDGHVPRQPPGRELPDGQPGAGVRPAARQRHQVVPRKAFPMPQRVLVAATELAAVVVASKQERVGDLAAEAAGDSARFLGKFCGGFC